MNDKSNNKRETHTRFSAIALATCLLGAGWFGQASATTAPPLWEQASSVGDSVTDNGDGTWTYNFIVHNDSTIGYSGYGSELEPVIVDWELPYFDDAGITDIVAPFGWAYAIETVGVANSATGWDGTAAWQDTGDPWYDGADSPYTTVTQVLHWYNLCWVTDGSWQVDGSPACGWLGEEVPSGDNSLAYAITPGNYLGGFGFTADYEPQAAPYQASWALLPIQTGDPSFPVNGVPASPGAQGTTAVPEPATLALLGLGLAGLGFRRRQQ